MIRKWISMLLVLALVLAFWPAALAAENDLTATATSGTGMDFSDVAEDDWYYNDVETAWTLGLMQGRDGGVFDPTGPVSLAEAVTLAARLHADAAGEETAFTQGEVWYRVYVEYALAAGILTEELPDYDRAATRLEFAHLLARALPEQALTAQNTVETGAIPDVANDAAVYLLYRAGVLVGSDAAGTFRPESDIARSEVAAVVSRMKLAALRKNITLTLAEPNAPAVTVTGDVLNENNALTVPYDLAFPEQFESGAVEYSGEQILIKFRSGFAGALTDRLRAAGITGLRELYAVESGVWYSATIDGEPQSVMEQVRALSEVLVAEYDYVYATEAVPEAVAGNPSAEDQWYLDDYGIPETWTWLTEQQIPAGGDSSIVVAVIDTGVDYTHPDLLNNMWVNSKEIPNNGIDDDNNGYVDDYYGVDAVAGKGSGMDDHGHGTHVAGIIAAANNNVGTVGIAYNTKIMALKAGQSSGFFNQSDIAECIIYAYEMGADVINMSFGGAASTLAVQDALELAYTRSVLVASAGNDSCANENRPDAVPSYPASLKYVLGVMSVDAQGVESGFTNYDVALYSTVEYEVYAPGEQILSTLPGGRYAAWSGTSMAAPVVSAMAALLRSVYSDRGTYPTKYIYGQLVSTGTEYATCVDPYDHGSHNLPKIVDAYAAATEVPSPDVGISDYLIFDTAGFSADTTGLTAGAAANNNGDGVIDAGEIIALGFTLNNRWGMSEDTVVSIDAISSGGVDCPYVTILNNDVNYGSVGTYSEGDCGRQLTDGAVTGWEAPFYLQISADCPNDYLIALNAHLTCGNALDPNDATVYTGSATLYLTVRRGIILNKTITADTTLTADNYYIIPNSLLIAAGATVTVEAGTQIQFWSDDPNDAYADAYIAYLVVEGTLRCEGTEESPVRLFPSEMMNDYRVELRRSGSGRIELEYTEVVNPYLYVSSVVGCTFSQNYRHSGYYYRYLSNGAVMVSSGGLDLSIGTARACSFVDLYDSNRYSSLSGSFDGCAFIDCALVYNTSYAAYTDCLFYGNNDYLGETDGAASSMQISLVSYGVENAWNYTDPDTGTVYLMLLLNTQVGTTDVTMLPYRRFAQSLGGDLASFASEAELMEIYTELGRVISKTGSSLSGASFIVAAPEGSVDHYARVYNGQYTTTYYTSKLVLLEIPSAAVETISLPAYALVLDTDGTAQQLRPTVTPVTASEDALIYESLDEAVVTVSEEGLITPVGEGTTEVRVYSSDRYVYNDVTVTVKAPVALESLALDGETTMAVDTRQRLGAILTPADSTKTVFTWSSSAPEVASVDELGFVTAHAPGEATITVENPETELSATFALHVIVPVADLRFADPLCALSLEDETVDLGLTVLPADATEPELSWSSSDESVAFVGEDGVLNKVGCGTAVLRVTAVGTDVAAEMTVAIVAPSGLSATVTDIQRTTNGKYIAQLTDGTLWAWGRDLKTPIKLPFDDVAAFYCADLSLLCYLLIVDSNGVLNRYTYTIGGSTAPQLDNSCFGGRPMTGVRAVAGSYYNGWSFYALKTDGTVWAWGNNSYGQLGDGTTTSRSVAFQIPDVSGVTQIAAARTGYNSASQSLVLLDQDGVARYVGNDVTAPTVFAEGISALRASGYLTGVLLESDNSVFLYDASYSNPSQTYAKATPETELFCCDEDSFYLQDGVVYASGRNYYGELGIGSTTSVYDEYVAVEGLSNAVKVFPFYVNTFVLTEDGRLYGMGQNDQGQLADFSTTDSAVPKRINFGITGGDAVPTLSATNLEAAVLNTETLTLDFSQAMAAGDDYIYVSMKDSAGNAVSLRKQLLLDKLMISAVAGFTAGETYTLTIPAAALRSRFSVALGASIVLTFTAGEDAVTPPVTPDETPETVVHTTRRNETVSRVNWTLEELQTRWTGFTADGYDTVCYGNAFLNRLNDTDVSRWMRVTTGSGGTHTLVSVGGNYWGTTNALLIDKQILDFDDFQTLYDLNEGRCLTAIPETVWPCVADAGLLREGEKVDVIGNETVTFYVEFNRDMDTALALDVRFGSYYPFADYEVAGNWVSPRRWEGSTTLTTLIENGYQYFSIDNARTAEAPHLALYKDWGRFDFLIDTTSAMSMTLQGAAGDEGITLTWEQDDFDTLAGYNIYRATAEDGLYVRLNSTVVPADVKTFFDDTVEPGVVYYYNFTVLQTDLSESAPSGKTQIRAKDTMLPTMYHTPVYNAFTGSNLVLSATVTDNVAVRSVTLYYRVVGETTWREAAMTSLNDKYSAVISANSITLAGLEYYISAYDGVGYSYRGTADAPYTVTVQEAVSTNSMGDVNGDGRINTLDALMLLQAVNDRLNLTTEQFARADLDGNKLLEAKEALRILQYANGKIGSVLYS